jgi:hypothetical protein
MTEESQQHAPEDVGEASAATKSLLRMLDELDPQAFAAEARENLPRIVALLDVGD